MVIDMNNNKKVPKIRFKGFTEDWEQRKLTSFVEFYNGQTYSPLNVQDRGTLVLRSSNVQNGEISKNDLVFIDSDIVNTNNVEIGDIIVVVRNGSRNLIGKHAQIKGKMTDTVIGAFMTGIRSNNPEFVNSLLNTRIFDDEINKNMGATINQITGYMFSNMEFKIPTNDEQSKIGDLFTNLDNLITLHQRKYDSLVNVKKSLLEKMFPKNSSNIPEIRFKGFTDVWEQRKLKELVHSVGTGKSKYNLSDYNKYPILGSRNIIGYDSSYDYSGDFILTARVGEYAGELYRYKGTVKITDNTVYLQGSDLDYLFYLLKKFNLKKLSFGSGQPLVKASELSNLDLFVSNNKTEKKKISDLFTNLDNLITLHQRKVEKLKNIKQSLLDKMFV